MRVKRFFVLIFLIFELAECVRIRKTRNRMAALRQQFNATDVITSTAASDAIVAQSVTEVHATSTQSILEKEIKSLIETLKSSRNSGNGSETRKNASERPRNVEAEKISEPKHIDLECKFGNASDYLSVEYPGRHLYTCESFNLRVLSENTVVASVLGEHETGMTSSSVAVFRNIFSKTRFIPNQLGVCFPNLQHLYMPSSRIQVVRRRNFVGMSQLHTLDLRYNEIEALDSDAFFDLFALEILSLSGNFLKKLPSTAFVNLHNLRYFDVSDNELTSFDDEVLATNVEIEEILLDHNRIKNIRTELERFRDISFIDLRGNVCIDTLYLKDHPDYPMLFELQEEINYNCTKRDSRDIELLPGTAELKSVLSWELCSHLKLPTNGKMCLTESKRGGE